MNQLDIFEEKKKESFQAYRERFYEGVKERYANLKKKHESGQDELISIGYLMPKP
jgi:hypothetical protein